MAINQDTLNAIISGLNTMPKKSEIDTPTNNIDLLATSTTDGLMSSSDKSKLDGIAVGANKYTHPETSGNKHIPSGGSDGQILKWESDGTAKWATETKYGLATETSGGLMSSTDKTNLDAAVSKLSGIAEGANNYSLPMASNSQLGGVKTTSSVTDATGLTACPIIEGVPYYKDTVGSYTLPTASNTTLGGVTTTSNVTSTTGLTACPIIAGIPYYPSALPATGGNADTVDGLHASDFMPINGEVRKYGLIRMNGSDGIRVRHIDGNDEIDGALYLNYWTPNAPIYMNGGNTAIHSGNIGSQSVNYATNAGNANTLNNITDGYWLGTLDINGGGHGAAHRLQCQYSKFGDGRFGFKIESGYEVRCDYATNADTINGIPSVNLLHKLTDAGTLNGVDTDNVVTGVAGFSDPGLATNHDLPTGSWVNILGYNCDHFFTQIASNVPSGDTFIRTRWHGQTWKDVSWIHLFSDRYKPHTEGSFTAPSSGGSITVSLGYQPSCAFVWTGIAGNRQVWAAQAITATGFTFTNTSLASGGSLIPDAQVAYYIAFR